MEINVYSLRNEKGRQVVCRVVMTTAVLWELDLQIDSGRNLFFDIGELISSSHLHD